MIEELIAVLRENEKLSELSPEQFTDIFWLAIQQSRFSGINKQEVARISQTNDIAPGKKNKSQTADHPQKKDFQDSSSKLQESQVPETSQSKADIFVKTASTHSQKSVGTGKLPIRLPDASALPNKLELGRSLKPLMRQIPSIYDVILDEVATTERIANERIWLPVLKPAPELWLELDLVVDAATSMTIWRNTILELRRLLENLGIFRNIRTWSLFTDNEEKVQIRPGIGSAALGKSNRNPRQLVNPNGRALVWVLSDCVSEMWRNGVKNGVQNDNIIWALNIWANSGSLAIVQMLPKWLWGRTALGLADLVELCGETPGVPNHQLQVRQLSLWDEINQNNQDIKVPVLTLKPEMVATWSQMVAGMGTVWASGVVFQLNTKNSNNENLNSENSNNQKSDETPTELTAQQRFQHFRLTASPMARRLASLLAAAPIVTLPVIRLIQKTMLSESSQVHVAEVLLGGLVKLKLEKQETDKKIALDTNPDEIEYQFIDGVDEKLIDSLSTTEEKNVKINLVEKLTEHIADKIGLSIETFRGFLDLRQIGFSSLQDNPIARIALDKLKQLGGKYKNFAELLEQIKSFTFETVTVNRRGEEINRETKQAQYFTETIKPVGGEVIPLEMVYIPGGTFMMGTEDEEIERLIEKFGNEEWYRREKPQHEVIVPPLFMGKYQITQEQWKAVANLPQVDRELNPEPSSFKGEDNQKNNLPVEQVSWYDAEEFCKRLSRHTGKQYRLASEAEWEYACRAGTTTPFHFGETITSELANYDASRTFADESEGEKRGKTTKVEQFPPNGFGLYDMHGNVWEWCKDHWHENYEGAPKDGNEWLDKSNKKNNENDNQLLRVLRGGSWDIIPNYCRSADRPWDYPDIDEFGFRVVCCVAPRTI